MKKKYSMKYVAAPFKDMMVIIHVELLMNHEKKLFSTGHRGKAKDWNVEKQRFSEFTKDYVNINSELEEDKHRMKDIYNRLVSREIPPNVDILHITFIRNKDLTYAPKLTDYIENRITELKALGRERYKPGTVAQYETMFKRLKEYLKSIKKGKMLLGNLNKSHIEEFKTYLEFTISESTLSPLSKSTIKSYLSKLSAVLNDAVKNEVILFNPFNGAILKRIRDRFNL